MEVFYCDVCKKPVENPIPQRTFFQYADIEICEPCRDELDVAVKSTLRAKKPFDYAWFNEYEVKILRESVQKGKISFSKR